MAHVRAVMNAGSARPGKPFATHEAPAPRASTRLKLDTMGDVDQSSVGRGSSGKASNCARKAQRLKKFKTADR